MLLAAAPQLLDHPIDVIVRDLPWWFFMAVHVALFLVGAWFALRAFEGAEKLFGWGFPLRPGRDLVHDLPREHHQLPLRPHDLRGARRRGLRRALRRRGP